jgi:hypothetical protein
MKTTTEAMTEILKVKDIIWLRYTHHLIYAAATLIAEEICDTGCYKSETKSPKTPLWVRWTHESINGIRKGLSALEEIKGDDMKAQNMKRKRHSHYKYWKNRSKVLSPQSNLLYN